MAVLRLGCDCFVIVYNMSQKVDRDYLGLKRIIWDVKGCLVNFEPGLRGYWAIVVGILLATFCLKD